MKKAAWSANVSVQLVQRFQVVQEVVSSVGTGIANGDRRRMNEFVGQGPGQAADDFFGVGTGMQVSQSFFQLSLLNRFGMGPEISQQSLTVVGAAFADVMCG